MGEGSAIEWTNHTFNPWEGCQRVSPGCENCYAEARNERFHGGIHWGPGPRLMRSEAYWKQPEKWNREAEKAGKRARVFCASLADVFEDRPDLVAPRARLARLIANTPSLDWLLLTKRPENVTRLWLAAGYQGLAPNIWLGTTVEDQKRADERIPHLVAVRARVRFLSCEPLLERVDLSWWLDCKMCRKCGTAQVPIMDAPTCKCPPTEDEGEPTSDFRSGMVDWVIVGGESGYGARRFDLAWARDIVSQCRFAGVAPFVKQMGAAPFVGFREVAQSVQPGAEATRLPPQTRLREEDGGLAICFVEKHGGDMAEWPADLRVREFPHG